MYEYRVKTVKKVVDGDTYDFEVDLGFGISNTQRFRLHGVDTPETFRPSCNAEAEHGCKATTYVKDIFKYAEEITVVTHKLGIYGRYEADVYVVITGVKKSLSVLLSTHNLLKLKNYGVSESTAGA